MPDSSTIGTFDDDWIRGDEGEKRGKCANGIGKPKEENIINLKRGKIRGIKNPV